LPRDIEKETLFYAYTGRLPRDIGKEIFSFLIPDPNAITFRKCDNYTRVDNYSGKYEIAFMGNKQIKNEKGEYLSRIGKKNGKNRYYLTKEYEVTTCQGCGSERCRSSYCRGSYNTEYYIRSKYIGRDITTSLRTLLLAI